MYKELKIHGFRGFEIPQTLKLAIPADNREGSGLTIVVGANNSGKSTIWESFRALSSHHTSFTEGKRNKKAGDRVEVSIVEENDKVSTVKTIATGGSETERSQGVVSCFTLASRRTFSPFFSKNSMDRLAYMSNYMQLPNQRGEAGNNFSSRLFNINDNADKRQRFNSELEKIFGFIPDWTIDQNDVGSHYVKLSFGNSIHNSDGAGEGFLSILTIVDALYDSAPGSLTIIDEPELSLHPALQRKLLNLFMEYSKDRQIVIFTHSPFFIDWDALSHGGELSRTVKETEGIKIYRLSDESKVNIAGLLSNRCNPHILGLEAKEAFFLEDNIILTEGQDDVYYYQKYFETNHPDIKGTFFGWGVGGASNMRLLTKILRDLGFKKVVGILDSNSTAALEELTTEYRQYRFIAIPTNDVRDKEAQAAKGAVAGLFTAPNNLKAEYQEEVLRIIETIRQYLNG